jgi:hypothetical protein
MTYSRKTSNLPSEDKPTKTARTKKPYSPPTLVRLDYDTLSSKLEAKAKSGDAQAQKLLELVREIEREKEARIQRPTLALELKFPQVKASDAELRLTGEHLTLDHLKLVRKYLDLSEAAMREGRVASSSEEELAS